MSSSPNRRMRMKRLHTSSSCAITSCCGAKLRRPAWVARASSSCKHCNAACFMTSKGNAAAVLRCVCNCCNCRACATVHTREEREEREERDGHGHGMGVVTANTQHPRRKTSIQKKRAGRGGEESEKLFVNGKAQVHSQHRQ